MIPSAILRPVKWLPLVCLVTGCSQPLAPSPPVPTASHVAAWTVTPSIRAAACTAPCRDTTDLEWADPLVTGTVQEAVAFLQRQAVKLIHRELTGPELHAYGQQVGYVAGQPVTGAQVNWIIRDLASR